MDSDDVDNFGSVAWDTNPLPAPSSISSPVGQPEPSTAIAARASSSTSHQQVYNVIVKDTVKELEGSKDMFVSYLVEAQTELPKFLSNRPSSRRRYQDFTFLRDHLTRDFPATVVPPLPDKHRMEYLTGDRFSNEFIERRRLDLQRFLERIARHPKLSRASLFQAFLESTEWNVFKHQQLSLSSDLDPPSGILDNISDTLLNAFTKVRKPDDRFIDMKVHLDQFEEGLTSIERLTSKNKIRLNDLVIDYEDFANSIQGLGYLESGITEPLLQFETTLVQFSHSIDSTRSKITDPFLEHLHSLLSYSIAFRGVLKLRDQKQLDFEELSAYLSNVVTERDRLAGGYGYGMGIGSYFKEKVDSLRGSEAEGTKEARMIKLDAKIKELQDAVISSSEASQAFNDEVLNEHIVFQLAKRVEMKELLGDYADGQILMYQKSIADWDKMMPHIANIPVESS